MNRFAKLVGGLLAALVLASAALGGAAGCGPSTAARLTAMSDAFQLNDFDTMDFRILPLDEGLSPLAADYLTRSFALSDIEDFPSVFPLYFNVLPSTGAAAALVEVDALRLGQVLASGGFLVDFYTGEIAHFPLLLASPLDQAACEAGDAGDATDQIWGGPLYNQNLCDTGEDSFWMDINSGERFGVRFLRVTPARHDAATVRIRCVDTTTDEERFAMDAVPIYPGLSLRTPPLASRSYCTVYTALLEDTSPPVEFDAVVYYDDTASCVESLPPPTEPLLRLEADEAAPLSFSLCPGSVLHLPLEMPADTGYLRVVAVPSAAADHYNATVVCADGSSRTAAYTSSLGWLELPFELSSLPPRGEEVHRCFLRMVSWHSEGIDLEASLRPTPVGGCPDDAFEPNDTFGEATVVPGYDQNSPPDRNFYNRVLCPLTGALDDPGSWHDWYRFTIPDDPDFYDSLWLYVNFTFDGLDEADYRLAAYRIEAEEPVEDTSWVTTFTPHSDRLDGSLCVEIPDSFAFGDYAVRVSCNAADCKPFYSMDFWYTTDWNYDCTP